MNDRNLSLMNLFIQRDFLWNILRKEEEYVEEERNMVQRIYDRIDETEELIRNETNETVKDDLQMDLRHYTNQCYRHEGNLYNLENELDELRQSIYHDILIIDSLMDEIIRA